MGITAYVVPVLVVYFALILGLGYYHSRKIENSEDFLVSGRNTGFWVLAGTIVGTNVGGGTMIGISAEAYRSGVSAIWPVLPSLIFIGLWTFLFVRYINRIRQVTLPDFLVLRFGERVRVPAAIFTMLRSIVLTGMQILAMASVVSTVLGWSMTASIIFSFVVTVGYCLLGGLHTVMVTDAIQTVIQTLGPLLIVTLIVFGLTQSGTLSDQAATLDPSMWNVWEPGWVVILGFIAASGPYYLIYQPMWQRVYAARDENTAVKSMAWGTVFSFLTVLLPITIGILAHLVAPADMDPNRILPWLYLEYFPPLVGSFFAVSLIAAIMSVLDSMVLDGSANLVRDIYQKRLNPRASERQLIRMGRVSILIISTLGLLMALALPNLIVLWVFANALAAGGIVVPALAAWFFKRATSRGAFWAIVGGGVGTAFWGGVNWVMTGDPGTPWLGISPVYVGFVISTALLIIISRNTPHGPDENPESTLYHWRDVAHADSPQASVSIERVWASFMQHSSAHPATRA
ncbi:sodium:solute symporter family protein [Kushneria indalinina]|uniref:SSS family solute:Na+ symporter n=1 Tax=Kushneria indalinina DSM 14324 TaxID=1122140 RepID=A0A3D9DXE8_9GAMM|nr:sodium:solute symporter family protein [Kushneria indalinina]REC95325.1 SSS family solute:Na+ symporter [Kushneria indalinina DSM 14324]